MLEAKEVAKLYQTDFIRNARAVGVLWAVCTLCFGILEIVVLIQPTWVRTADRRVRAGAAPASLQQAVGYFGLYQVCVEMEWAVECRGSLSTLTPVPAFKAAAVFIFMALILVLTSVGCFALFWFCNAATVYKVCAWLQLTAATCQALGCLIFPDGWGAPEVRPLCGRRADSYQLGDCTVHWGFTLAILGMVDALVLSVLAFVLGNRQDALLPDDYRPEKKVGLPAMIAPDL
ncbi:LHFPL tetraspan subfamily member 3 protein-like [Ambystoma mexicanum]|uniref:LHFPL tetraspan subfamily member 3 protein-like n=1 Tax=Ambystoma mexicanum TaxID=8296 RepID=UPI0037E8720B